MKEEEKLAKQEKVFRCTASWHEKKKSAQDISFSWRTGCPGAILPMPVDMALDDDHHHQHHVQFSFRTI